MIITRRELKECLKYERSRYRLRLFDYITQTQKVATVRYVSLLRKCEYYKNRGGGLSTALFILTRVRKNRLGKKLGIEIGENSCGKGLLIFHSGFIVINSNSRIGENLVLHGSNCIGNSGTDSACPIIGDNVELGVGAVVIGNVKIGDHVKIGANATCVKSCERNYVTLVGTPAVPIEKIGG